MNILIIGAETALGKAVMYLCPSRGCKGTACDITFEQSDNIDEYIERANADCVMFCQAYMPSDESEGEREKADEINCKRAERAAAAAERIGAKFIYVSTDFVFDGFEKVKRKPMSQANPINAFGSCKLAGEKACTEKCSRTFIVRTSRLYGKGEDDYIGRVLKCMKQGRSVEAPYDRLASPTYVKDLAVLLLEMAQSQKYGVYHGVNEGYCSLYEMALEIKRLCGYSVSVLPVRGDGFAQFKREPAYCVLDTSCLDGKFRRLPPWKDALMRYLEDEGELLW